MDLFKTFIIHFEEKLSSQELNFKSEIESLILSAN